MTIKKNTQRHDYLGQMLKKQMPEIVDVLPPLREP